MEKSKAEEIALFRYGIIAPLVREGKNLGISKRQFFEQAAGKTYTDPFDDAKIIKVSSSTIKRWYKTYTSAEKGKELDALMPKERSDISKQRKVDDDIIKQITYMLDQYPRLPASVIYKGLQDNGTITADEVSLSTINRTVNKIKKSSGTEIRKEMHRYEREHINEVWCGDTSYGPYIKIDGKKRRTYVIALIDDASRYIVGAEIFLNDNFVNLMSVIKSAVRMHGKPKFFNFDNGSNYKSHQMQLLAARMGSTISYCAPRTPTSKAKIERWFRTMKDHWMAGLNMNDYKSLSQLNISLQKYVQQYNQMVHSSLEGKTPPGTIFQ